NQYLSFTSHHPTAHKVAVIRTLMTRANTLSSSGVERVQEEKQIVEALQENGYPPSFVHKHSHPRRPRREMDDQKPRTTLTLPYIAGLSEAVRRILAPLEIKVAFRPQSTLRSLLVHPKDPVPMDQRKGVVYSVPCDGCSKVYIGQTGRSLKHRLAEHRRALKNGDVAASALAEHTLATGHLVDLTKSEVIDCHPYATTRCLLESWHIQRNPDALNREKGTLPEVYTALLE
ncbi:MAG: GIY-YIG nuclease family protein, partial [Alphaproteobacteria bacterium]|nr:GIY-YIG nuclease family protein [Alphaproteobacteria bacterium]